MAIISGKTPYVPAPPFMESMRLIQGRRGEGSRRDRWGFVVFKGPEIRDSAQWSECQRRFDQVLKESLSIYHGYAGLDDCVSRMEIQWVEDVPDAEASMASVAR
jgi:hypothetical protein